MLREREREREPACRLYCVRKEEEKLSFHPWYWRWIRVGLGLGLEVDQILDFRGGALDPGAWLEILSPDDLKSV